MERLEKSGHLVQDANEGKWIVDSLQRIVNRNAPQEVKTRAEELIKTINQRLMSQYPLGTKIDSHEEQIWHDLEARYLRTPEPEHVEQQPEQQKDSQPKMNDDDEMAETAGRLLERVADNTSEKFQNSQFLQLMRRLRDREVRVEEDKIVEVDHSAPSPPSQSYQPQSQLPQQQSNPPTSAMQEATPIPPIDPTILSHAATDFEMPIYSDEGHDQYAPHSHPPPPYSSSFSTGDDPFLTDEISDQFRNYNVNGAYHR
jgi:hypothetical protein